MTDAPALAPPRRTLADQVLRFLMVGGSAAALDFCVLMTVVHFGGSRYFSRFLSVAIAVTYTWWLNRRLTFATIAPPSWREFIHYVSVALAGLLLNLALYSAALWAGAPIWLAFCCGSGSAAVFNFLRYRALLGNRPA